LERGKRVGPSRLVGCSLLDEPPPTILWCQVSYKSIYQKGGTGMAAKSSLGFNTTNFSEKNSLNQIEGFLGAITQARGTSRAASSAHLVLTTLC